MPSLLSSLVCCHSAKGHFQKKRVWCRVSFSTSWYTQPSESLLSSASASHLVAFVFSQKDLAATLRFSLVTFVLSIYQIPPQSSVKVPVDCSKHWSSPSRHQERGKHPSETSRDIKAQTCQHKTKGLYSLSMTGGICSPASLAV